MVITAELADIAADVVGVHGEHGKGEGLILLGDLRQLLLGIVEEDVILVAPPDEVVGVKDLVLVPGGIVVVDFVHEVIFVVWLSAAEVGIGAHHQRLVVAVFLQYGLQVV